MYREIAEQLYHIFVVNATIAGVQQVNSKYYTVKAPISVSLIEEMLKGGYALGTYQQITNQDKLKWICFDFDCKEYENKEFLRVLRQEYVELLIVYLENKQISYLLEYSGRRGIHVWIFFDQIISKDLGFTIVSKLREIFYSKIKQDERFDIDCFPKTGSGKVKNKYGLMVKLPLSRHQSGTYSYFIDKNESKFEFINQLTPEFLNSQLMFLKNIEVNSVEKIIESLEIEQKFSTENLIKYHKQFIVAERNISLNDIKEAFKTDVALNEIWNRIAEGRMSGIDRVIVLGMFSNIESGELILNEILRKQQNYNAQISHNMIVKYKKYYFPISFGFLYELNGNQECPIEKRTLYVDEYLYDILNIPYNVFENKKRLNMNFVQNIIEKEENYFLYNDEVYNLPTWYQLQNFSYYDYCKIEEYLMKVEEGNASIPSSIEYYKYIRKEDDKKRELISLGAQERVITTALVNKMIMYLQRDYSSYSYHLNFDIGGDVFYPWISSWTRFKNDVSQFFSFSIFSNYTCIKMDIKSFYSNIYLQTMFNDNLLDHEGEQYKKFTNIFMFLNSFNEKIMLDCTGDLRGVPQGPAYARVLAEIVLEQIISSFFEKKEIYNTVKYYRYVDDIFLFCPATIDGQKLLNELADQLESKGLYLNLKKTKNYGKIKDMSIQDVNELQEFKDLNYDVFQLREKNWISSIDEREFDNVYIRYIYRKKKWDINDANVIFSDKISDSLQKRFMQEFYSQIITSEFGRGSMFRKFYKKIFSSSKYLNDFMKNRDFMKIPLDSINFQNMLSMFILDISNISNLIDDNNYLLVIRDYLKKMEKSVYYTSILILLNAKIEEGWNEDC